MKKTGQQIHTLDITTVVKYVIITHPLLEFRLPVEICMFRQSNLLKLKMAATGEISNLCPLGIMSANLSFRLVLYKTFCVL